MSVRSARCAPNEQVRQSVKAHPSNTKRHDPPVELSLPRDSSPSRKSPSKRSPQSLVGGNFEGADIDDELFQNAPAINPSTISLGAGRVNGDFNQHRIGVPQRVEPPKDLNTPLRNDGGGPKPPSETDGAGPEEPAADSPEAAASLAKNLGSLAANKKQARPHSPGTRRGDAGRIGETRPRETNRWAGGRGAGAGGRGRWGGGRRA